MRPSPPLLALALLAGICPATAGEFSNSYISFLLPSGWSCAQEQTEFVCNPPLATGEKAAAIMILTAKEAGPQDTLSDYMRHLHDIAGGLGVDATLVAPYFHEIGATIWVDGTLEGSELPGYSTRYLATVKGELAVLFTFSAHRSRYDDLVGGAFQAVSTLCIRDDWRERVRAN